MSPIPDWVREIVCCPTCKGELSSLDGDERELACVTCQVAYPVTDGILVLLAADARPLE